VIISRQLFAIFSSKAFLI